MECQNTSRGSIYFITVIDHSLQPQVRIMFIWIKTRVKRWQSSIRLIRWQSGLSPCFPFPVGRSQLRNYCGHFDSTFTNKIWKNWKKLKKKNSELDSGFFVLTCTTQFQTMIFCPKIKLKKKEKVNWISAQKFKFFFLFIFFVDKIEFVDKNYRFRIVCKNVLFKSKSIFLAWK